MDISASVSKPTDASRVLASYAVIPSVERARFLLPLVNRCVTTASLLAYNALRSPRVRIARLGLAAVAALGGLGRFPVLTISTESTVDDEEILLTGWLAGRLGTHRLHAALGVGTPDPNAKPTMQLFDDRGTPRGYAKVGWNGATRALVRSEATALAGIPAGVPDYPFVPRVLWCGSWGEREITVVDPLPAAVRRLSPGGSAQVDAVCAVARGGRPPAPPEPLRDAPVLLRLIELATAAPAAAAGDAARQAWPRFRSVLEALLAQHGDTPVELGDWHGDWVPWNLGRHQRRLVAWDWEHHGRGVPVGFDLAHHAFQCALTLRHEPAASAAEAMTDALERHGPALGLTAAQRIPVGDAYLLELWARTYRLAAGGAGWNDKLHPSLLDVLDARLGLGAPAGR